MEDVFDVVVSLDISVMAFLEAVLERAKKVYSDIEIKFSVGRMSLLLPDSSPMKNYDMVSTLFREHPEYGSSIPLNVSVDISFPLSVAPQVSSSGEMRFILYLRESSAEGLLKQLSKLIVISEDPMERFPSKLAVYKFHGRSVELANCVNWFVYLTKLIATRRGCILVLGISGSGKTRFGFEFSRSMWSQNGTKEQPFFVEPFFLSFNGFGDFHDPEKSSLTPENVLSQRLVARMMLNQSVEDAESEFPHISSIDPVIILQEMTTQIRKHRGIGKETRLVMLFQIDELQKLHNEKMGWKFAKDFLFPLRIFEYENACVVVILTQTGIISKFDENVAIWNFLPLPPLSDQDMTSIVAENIGVAVEGQTRVINALSQCNGIPLPIELGGTASELPGVLEKLKWGMASYFKERYSTFKAILVRENIGLRAMLHAVTEIPVKDNSMLALMKWGVLQPVHLDVVSPVFGLPYGITRLLLDYAYNLKLPESDESIHWNRVEKLSSIVVFCRASFFQMDGKCSVGELFCGDLFSSALNPLSSELKKLLQPQNELESHPSSGNAASTDQPTDEDTTRLLKSLLLRFPSEPLKYRSDLELSDIVNDDGFVGLFCRNQTGFDFVVSLPEIIFLVQVKSGGLAWKKVKSLGDPVVFRVRDLIKDQKVVMPVLMASSTDLYFESKGNWLIVGKKTFAKVIPKSIQKILSHAKRK